jgi:hypothetical protein
VLYKEHIAAAGNELFAEQDIAKTDSHIENLAVLNGCVREVDALNTSVCRYLRIHQGGDQFIVTGTVR